MARKRKGKLGIGEKMALAFIALALLLKVLVDYWYFFLPPLIAYAVYRYRLWQARRSQRISRTDTDWFPAPAIYARASPMAKPAATPRPAPPARVHAVEQSAAMAKPVDDIAAPTTNAGASMENELHYVDQREVSAHQAGFPIPSAPGDVTATRWLDKSATIVVDGIRIKGALIYFGAVLKAANDGIEPSLVDPRQPVAKSGHYSERHTGHQPAYDSMSPQARRAYLLWLADGRSAPDADIGYVFLYFYGLERRIILDLFRDKLAPDELPMLRRELQRLFAHYAEQSASFKVYCGQLMAFIDAAGDSSKRYEDQLDDLPASEEFPFALRLAIGQATRDGVPISSALALAWAERDPVIIKRTAARRCADEFKKLFTSTYTDLHGAGMHIAPGHDRLKLLYQPASGGFMGVGGVEMTLGDTPDVTTLAAPREQLRMMVDACEKLLAPYSRYLASDPDGWNDPQARLLLPVALWPEAAKKALEKLRHDVSGAFVRSTFRQLFAAFDAGDTPTKDLRQALSSALETAGIGIEPDLREMRAGTPDDCVVLFHSAPPAAQARDDAAFQVAKLSVELAAAVAPADAGAAANGGFTLDAARIAALQESSDRIGRRLAGIFAEEMEAVPASPAAVLVPVPETFHGFCGLDRAHSGFARTLLSRPSWRRAELLDMARDLNIMLDGALEKLNEASLDELDTNFSDGDDPVEINQDLTERTTP